MQSRPQRITAPAVTSIAVALTPERQISNLVYQGTTLAAILWLLAGLWVF